MNGDDKQPSEPPTLPEQQDTAPEPQFYVADPTTQPVAPVAPDVTWTASEFVAHEKSSMWYVYFMAGMAVLIAVVYLLMRDYISIAVVVIIGVLFMIMAGRQPRVLNYSLDDKGITIGPKFYPYSVLKSYGLVDEGAFSSIVLMPLQRFMPPISVYYAPADQERIVAVLGQHLPFSNDVHDALDTLMRRLKF